MSAAWFHPPSDRECAGRLLEDGRVKRHGGAREHEAPSVAVSRDGLAEAVDTGAHIPGEAVARHPIGLRSWLESCRPVVTRSKVVGLIFRLVGAIVLEHCEGGGKSELLSGEAAQAPLGEAPSPNIFGDVSFPEDGITKANPSLLLILAGMSAIVKEDP